MRDSLAAWQPCRDHTGFSPCKDAQPPLQQPHASEPLPAPARSPRPCEPGQGLASRAPMGSLGVVAGEGCDYRGSGNPENPGTLKGHSGDLPSPHQSPQMPFSTDRSLR